MILKKEQSYKPKKRCYSRIGRIALSSETGVGYVIGVHGGINPVRGVDLKIRSNREAEK